ncbi:phage integrase SAM-like domain-containing protein [Siphonobacter sp. SORGH_AS_0500]|uniref:phage integrase SAM-like domain-containing protein n=1 Tax=Siphonobacter sp. SORGH_AS_0500 TaxID=1864824 RepID=UPI0038F5E403
MARTHIRPQNRFFIFNPADLFIHHLRKQGKYNRVNTDIPHINDFLNNADISFQEITVPLLERYRTYVKVNVR